MSDAFPSRPTTLTDYLAIFRRRLWIVWLPLVLVPGLSLVLSAGQKPLYRASAEIYVQRGDPTSSDLSGTEIDAVRYLKTLASVVRDPKLAARVVASAGMPGMTPGSFLSNSSVTPSPDADLLEVAVTNLGAQSAVRLVNTYARESAIWTRNTLSNADKEYIKSLKLIEHCDNFTVVHSTLYSPELFEYIQTSYDAHLSFEQQTTPLSFMGHSHVPVNFFKRKNVSFNMDTEVPCVDPGTATATMAAGNDGSLSNRCVFVAGSGLA